MRIVVTGTKGQVARALQARIHNHPDYEVILLGRPDIDLLNPTRTARTIRDLDPDTVVSAAAYTAVDQAEDEPEAAMTINGEAPGEIARAAAGCGAPVLHLSTDYVFSGDGERAYTESDETGPVTVYGRTKLAGEQAVAGANDRHVILRTAWVYSPFGKNFAKTMLGLAASRDSLSVVDDQTGNPTEAHDIADGIFAVLDVLRRTPDDPKNFGIFHMAGADETTWCGFAREIFRQSAALGGPSADVTPTTSDAFPTKARRPANSRLNSAKFAAQFDCHLPGYRTSLAKLLCSRNFQG